MARLLVLANEATAAQRRVYFHLVDATDGLTAETGEAAGQPQVSSDGGAWTNTGIGTLNAIGNGRYYADLTQTLVQTAGTLIETRYKSANTAECPGDSVQVVAFDPNDTVRLGLTALPNAAAEAAGGLYTRGTGAGQINQDANGRINANVAAWLGTAPETPDTAGVPHVNFVYLNNNTATVDNIGNVFGTDFATNYDDTNNRWLVDVRMISGDATAADNAEAFFDGTGYAGTGNVIPTVTAVTAISSGGITEASFATTAGSFHPLGIIDQGTAQAATGTTLQLRSAAAFANDELLGAWILITGGTTGVGQVRRITDYVASTDTATVDTWTTTPSGTITYKIFAAPPVIDVNVSHVGGTAGSVGVFPSGSITSNVLATGCIGADQVAADAIGADELATDAITEVVNAVWANATRTLSAATNITSTGGTTVPQTGDSYARLGAPAGASVSADVAAVKVDTAATVVDTNELQTDWANGGRLDLLVDAILDDTGTSGVAIASATMNSIADSTLIRGVSNVQDTADTTSLAAIILAILESSVSGTTWTIRKTGGTTFVTKTITTDAAADPITGVT